MRVTLTRFARAGSAWRTGFGGLGSVPRPATSSHSCAGAAAAWGGGTPRLGIADLAWNDASGYAGLGPVPRLQIHGLVAFFTTASSCWIAHSRHVRMSTTMTPMVRRVLLRPHMPWESRSPQVALAVRALSLEPLIPHRMVHANGWLGGMYAD